MCGIALVLVALITDYPPTNCTFSASLIVTCYGSFLFNIQNVSAFQERLFTKVNVSVNVSPDQQKINGTLKNESIQGCALTKIEGSPVL